MTRFLLGAGGAAILILLLGIWHFHEVKAARLAGQREERLVWNEAQSKANAKADADREAAQLAINAAEASYLKTRSAADVQKAELTKALDDEKAALSACTAVSRQLRDKLNPIGRRS